MSAGLLSVWLLGCSVGHAHMVHQPRVLLTQRQALELAFPAGSLVERRTLYLTEEEVRQAEEIAKVKLESRVWSYYVGTSSFGAKGFAFFDTQVVRAEPETFMAVVDEQGILRQAEILVLRGPAGYRSLRQWLRTDGVRRVLGIYAILRALQQKKSDVAVRP